MSDILERLKAANANNPNTLAEEAIAEIERLRAKNAELWDSAAFLTQYRVELTEKVISLEKKNAALSSNNGRLTKQVKRLLMFVQVWDQEYAASMLGPHKMDCACMLRLLPYMNSARAALAAKGGEEA